MSDIGKETKERVRQAAKALGYTPNVAARGLVLKRSFTVGLVATELSNPSRTVFVEALRRLALENGYQLLVGGIMDDAEVGDVVREMAARGVDGLIMGNVDGILAEKPYWPTLEGMRDSGAPVVAFYNAVTTKVDNVFIDYARLTKELTAHLIDRHGLTRIAFAGQDLEYHRAQGYVEAMRDAGLGGNTALIPLEFWSLSGTCRGIARHVATGGPPQAIVCHNDLTAIGVVAGLRECGLSVPRDVAVVGIDNIEMSGFLAPTLTTAGTDPSSVAATLFGLLRDRIDAKHDGAPRRVELPFTTFFRESCGCTGHRE